MRIGMFTAMQRSPDEDPAAVLKALREQVHAALDFTVTAEQPGVLVDLTFEWHKDFVYFAGEATPEALARQLKKKARPSSPTDLSPVSDI